MREQITIKEGGPGAQDPSGTFNVCGFGIDFTPCEALLVATTVEFGGIHIENMAGSVLIASSIVQGNIKVEANVVNAPEVLILNDNRVNGNMQVFKNVGSGNKNVQGNIVAQTLQCFENDPPFTAPFNNATHSEGQCAIP